MSDFYRRPKSEDRKQKSEESGCGEHRFWETTILNEED